MSRVADLRFRAATSFQRRVNPIVRRLPLQTVLETKGRVWACPAAPRWAAAASATPSGWCRSSANGRSTCATSRPIRGCGCGSRGRWHTGTAHLLPDDDPVARLRRLPKVNGLGVRAFGTDLLTVRVDLAG
ncbi:Deazaflavin-dependent oxidoreductase (Nitroreductase family) OS=Streptomyces violarus OX=67380 GN=FHS41_006638 PE=4 SV=1 [Streptomyces violarus]